MFKRQYFKKIEWVGWSYLTERQNKMNDEGMYWREVEW